MYVYRSWLSYPVHVVFLSRNRRIDRCEYFTFYQWLDQNAPVGYSTLNIHSSQNTRIRPRLYKITVVFRARDMRWPFHKAPLPCPAWALGRGRRLHEVDALLWQQQPSCDQAADARKSIAAAKYNCPPSLPPQGLHKSEFAQRSPRRTDSVAVEVTLSFAVRPGDGGGEWSVFERGTQPKDFAIICPI